MILTTLYEVVYEVYTDVFKTKEIRNSLHVVTMNPLVSLITKCKTPLWELISRERPVLYMSHGAIPVPSVRLEPLLVSDPSYRRNGPTHDSGAVLRLPSASFRPRVHTDYVLKISSQFLKVLQVIVYPI